MIIYIDHNQNTHFEILFSIIDIILNKDTEVEMKPDFLQLKSKKIEKLCLKKKYIEICKYRNSYFNQYNLINYTNRDEIDLTLTTTI